MISIIDRIKMELYLMGYHAGADYYFVVLGTKKPNPLFVLRVMFCLCFEPSRHGLRSSYFIDEEAYSIVNYVSTGIAPDLTDEEHFS
jgi:hypothetical protein